MDEGSLILQFEMKEEGKLTVAGTYSVLPNLVTLISLLMIS